MKHNFSYFNQALKEEVESQSPKYDGCVQSGLSILDKCDPDSSDAHDLNRKVEQVRCPFNFSYLGRFQNL